VSRLLSEIDALAAEIGDGSLIALPPDYSGVAMAATRALVRRGARRLTLVTVPQSGIQADILIGAGCVAAIETAAVTMGELGPAPRFTAAVKSGALTIKDSTCPAIHAALQAAEKGIPFMALRGILGSDLLRHRTDWRVIDNPMADGKDEIVLLPALKPDIGLFHAPLADRDGNVWIGRRRELVTIAHAAARSLVTVERVVEGSLLDDERMAAGVLPGLYVDAVAVAPRGALPIGLTDHYETDGEALRRYVAAAATEAGFAAWLADWLAAGVVGRAAAE
jgi:glutaconate CoA-transferase subunit A